MPRHIGRLPGTVRIVAAAVRFGQRILFQRIGNQIEKLARARVDHLCTDDLVCRIPRAHLASAFGHQVERFRQKKTLIRISYRRRLVEKNGRQRNAIEGLQSAVIAVGNFLRRFQSRDGEDGREQIRNVDIFTVASRSWNAWSPDGQRNPGAAFISRSLTANFCTKEVYVCANGSA